MTEAPKAAAPSDERKRRLLIVADGDAQHLYYTGILLQRLEYTIYTTRSAEDALEIMNISVPALLLTEVKLDKMNGLDLLRAVKTNAATKAVPVIVYGEVKDPSHRELCLKAGAAAFVSKPVDPDALYAAIQKATETTPRSFIRLKTMLQVAVGEVAGLGGNEGKERVTALSEHGLYVSTFHPKPKGTMVPVTLFLDGAAIRIDGIVLYATEKDLDPTRAAGMGIKFVRIRPEDQEKIRAFIKEQVTQDLRLG